MMRLKKCYGNSAAATILVFAIIGPCYYMLLSQGLFHVIGSWFWDGKSWTGVLPTLSTKFPIWMGVLANLIFKLPTMFLTGLLTVMVDRLIELRWLAYFGAVAIIGAICELVNLAVYLASTNFSLVQIFNPRSVPFALVGSLVAVMCAVTAYRWRQRIPDR